MARVLVVEAGPEQRASELLTAEGFAVFTAVERGEAIECLAGFRPDLVLVEVASPRGRGIEISKQLRGATAVPLVMVSGPCPENDALAAFAAGIDSLVVAPVGPHELVARLRALLRRIPPMPEVADDMIVVGPITLDRARRELRVGTELVPVPRREFDIAELLMRDAGRVVPRSVIVRELWGSKRDTKSLDVQVGRLRSRLAAVEGMRRILTVRGVGFRFVTDDELGIDLVAEEASDPVGEPASAC